MNYEFFESNLDADWFFQDFSSGIISVMCEDVFNFLVEENQLNYSRLSHLDFQKGNFLNEILLER